MKIFSKRRLFDSEKQFDIIVIGMGRGHGRFRMGSAMGLRCWPFEKHKVGGGVL
jgi:hypothetical protein